MSALSTLKKFLMNNNVLAGHSHPDAILKWFSEKHKNQKKVKISFKKYSGVVISDEYVEYTCCNKKCKTRGKFEDVLIAHYIMHFLQLYSANYCKYCRDKRRRFWEMCREIIERLPRNVGKFVMNLPTVEGIKYLHIVLSDTKFVYRGPYNWYMNDICVGTDELLEAFKKEYNAAKIPKLSEKYWRFADVSVLYRA